ncbi:MAG TPA: surface-adhesin E family protein [Steroidobacteraceae bacterium]|jgi:hypothetical protein|nr:surface-adhesin E family protein [Steroidobacteraceae bacterium]
MVRKFSSLLVALGIMAGAPEANAGSTDWLASTNWEVMEWTAPVTVSVDTASIAAHAARITARVMWDYAETQNTRGQAAAPFKSMVGIVVFDCATKRFGGAGSVAYSGDGGDGEAVAQYAINPENAALSSTEPGTIGRDLLTYVCAHAPRASRTTPREP